MKLCHIFILNVLLFFTAAGQFSDPFSFQVDITDQVVIDAQIPEKHYLLWMPLVSTTQMA